MVFVVGAPSHAHTNAHTTLAIFSAPFWSFRHIFTKSVYEPNFATFLVISTLIFCSLCLMFFIFCVSSFLAGLPHEKGVCILDVFYRFNRFNSKWRVKYLVLFVVCAASLSPSRCKQNSRKFFFQRLLRVSSHFFTKRVYEPNFATFLVISTLIFCSLCLMFFILCVCFCVGGLPHKKGVCILDVFYRFNRFNSKWRVKYLVLFVVCAASLRPSRCFFQRLLRVSSKCLPNAFMS